MLYVCQVQGIHWESIDTTYSDREGLGDQCENEDGIIYLLSGSLGA